MRSGTILLLNGCSSSGKSSLARHLQALADREQFLHVQLDTFREMEPVSYFAQEHAHQASVRVQALCRAINASALTFAQHGQNVIVDHVLDRTAWSILLSQLVASKVLLVKVSCELPVLEQRERGRSERKQGLARSQFSSVHAGRLYDFEVNTSATPAEELAHSVLQWYRGCPQPRAFPTMRQGESAA